MADSKSDRGSDVWRDVAWKSMTKDEQEQLYGLFRSANGKPFHRILSEQLGVD